MILVSFELAWQQVVGLTARWALPALRFGVFAVEGWGQAWALPAPVVRVLRVQCQERWIQEHWLQEHWILDPWVARSVSRGLVDPRQAVAAVRCWYATHLPDATPEACSLNGGSGVVPAILVARRSMRWLEDSVMQRARRH